MFTYKITKVQRTNYWERLHEFKSYSLQRRRGRYINIIIIYIWKITQHMATNINGTMGNKIKTIKHWRHRTQYVIQYPTNRNPAQSLQENAITVFSIGSVVHSLPKYLRGIESVTTEKIKFELDKFMELIPDEPKMPNYVTASGSNRILDHLTHLRAQGIYRSGGVPDSAREQSYIVFETTPSIQVHLEGVNTGGINLQYYINIISEVVGGEHPEGVIQDLLV